MEVFRSLEEAATGLENAGPNSHSVVTIGNFDGIHRAHEELLRRVLEQAPKENAASAAVTFDPHPLRILASHKAPKLLTPLPLKLELFEETGVDRVLVLPFTHEFSRWSPEKFVEEVLAKALKAVAVVVGDNFRFGHKHVGTPEMLTELGRRFHFRTEIVPQISIRKKRVSSSQIRRLLEAGKIALANRLLGRCFSIRGSVEPGLGIGHRQTVPTLNLGRYDELIPAAGVYVTWAAIGGRKIRSVTNVGRRPTFGERELGVETHLLEPWQGEPPAEMEVAFLYRLRDERKFNSAEELKYQILKDVRRAESYFRRLEGFGAGAE